MFRSSPARRKVVRDGCGTSPTAHALRSLSLASSSDASPRPLPSRRCSRWTSRHHLAMVRPPPRSPDLRALLHLRSRCERSTVASRVLHVASLGFSFRGVSCPTRRSSELRARNPRRTECWGLLVHPGRTQGQQPPSPMVLIGSAKQSRRAARSEERRSQRRPTWDCSPATRFVLVGGDTHEAISCAPARTGTADRNPRAPEPHVPYGTLRRYATHTQSTSKGTARTVARALSDVSWFS